MDTKPATSITTHRAPFHCIDPFGHLSTVHYLAFFVEHRFAALREGAGLDLPALSKLPFAFVTRRASISFIRPIVGDEPFTVASSPVEFGALDCRVQCVMRKLEGELAATCDFEVVCVSRDRGRPVAWDPAFLERFRSRL
jgi:acyl-CoA thioesterase FadM